MNQKETLINSWQNIKESLATTLILLLLTASSFSLNAQVVINEIFPSGTVELLNTGTSTVDVSGYWLCDFPAYSQLSNSNIQCGELMLAAGETVTVDDFNFVAADDGEMGLYTSSAFSNSSAIIDYVEWGSSGHQRASVAAAAGIWTIGDFVPAFSTDESLSYSGSGDGVSSWSAGTPTICPATSCDANGGAITLDNGDTSTSICVDGIGDPLDVIFTENPAGSSQGWVITDTQNNILGLPAGGPFDLDGAGTGTCLIWAISYESDFTGAAVGANVSDLTGCFDLSNAVTVYREAADGGTVATTDGQTTVTATAGDVVVSVQHTNDSPNLSYWYIVTEENDNILTWLNSADGNTLDLSGAPAGECHIWGWSYRGEGDPIPGDNISTLTDGDCEAISDNFITVIREAADCDIVTNDITLENGETTASICVDGNPDPLTVITNGGTEGTQTGWIITDAATNNILGLPAGGPFDLDGAGTGTCEIWYVRYEEGNFDGAVAGNNLSDLTGCFDLSNPITVYREAADGGMVSLANGETTITATAGNVVLDVQHTTTAPNLSYWYIITDGNDNILEFANSANGNTLDLSGAPAGICHIWGWSYRGEGDPIPGDDISTLADGDCEAISDNWITVIREEAGCNIVTNDIALENGETTASICVDGNPDPLTVITNGGTEGTQTGWIITDAATNNILGLPAGGPFDLDGAGTGTCEIWYVRYEEGNFDGAATGNNLSDLTGCFDLSNPITVYREAADGGMVSLANGETTITATAGNVVLDVQHTTTAPNLSYWYIITDGNDNILEFANSADGNTLDLSGAPAGICHIWGWSYRGEGDPIPGDDISTLADGDCEAISDNWITVIREEAGCNIVTNDIALENGETTASICVDGVADPLTVVTGGGTAGTETGWIITDAATNNILGLPAGGPFDLDGAGTGTCEIWYVRYEEGNFDGAAAGNNLADLTGCFDLSNPITVYREAADGGMVSLANGETTITATAGNVVLDVQHTTTAPNLSYWYIITDGNDNILEFANSTNGNTLDLSGAPAGICHIWGWSYRGEGDPIPGDDISTLADGDCEAISDNWITVIREEAGCNIVTNDIALDNGETTASICVDGVADPLTVVTGGGTPGTETGWIITDAATNNILGLPAGGPFDLDGAGTGTCEIWYVRYEEGNFDGAAAGNNLSDLTGCFDLSNPITVYREAADGGMVSLANGETTITATAGNVVLDVQHTTTAPNLSYWYIITDGNDNILEFANSANGNTLDLSGAPAGICHIWGWSYRGEGDPIPGDDISTLADGDCEAISDNWITVIREEAACEIVTNDIALDNGETTASICVDGVADPLTVVTAGGTAGTETGWIITDAATNNILGLPAGGPFDLDGAGTGTCEIWYVRYEEGNFDGAAAGNNLADLTGCFDLSNPITVYREAADGGMVSLANGETTITATAGNVVLDVQHTTTAPNLSYWYIITDGNDNILEFANSANGNTLDLSGAPAGICHIWGWSYRGEGDPIPGDDISTLADGDCEAISDNWITVIREEAACEIVTNDIALENGETTASICVDGVADPLTVVTGGGTAGTETGWIITDAATNNILGLPAGGPFDLDGAGTGTCEIWYVRYEAGNFDGAAVGNNLADLTGCFDLSNPITVYRESPDGGTVTTTSGETFVTAPAGNVLVEVQHTTNAPNLSFWYIITDINDNILGFMNSANGNTLDLSGAPAGECHIWGWSYRGEGDPIQGDNISTLADGDCEAISDNFITVIRQATTEDCEIVTNSITLENGETTTSICVDGNADPLTVVTGGGTPDTDTGWIITDAANNNILALPAAGPFDLDGAGTGTCEIWYIRYEAGNFDGAAVGNNLADLTGCFDLSNPIVVIREAADGGTVSTTDGATTVTATAGDVIVEVQHTTTAPNLSYWYIITDANDNILEFANSANGNTLDLSAAPAGECHIWGWSYRGEGDPIPGDNISTLADGDCEAISDNFITVIREDENNGGDTDVSLTIGSMNTTYDQYQNVVYTLIVSNDSNTTASGVVVSAALPSGMVFTSASTPNGFYNLFFEEWTIGDIPAGENAVLNLTLFPLASGSDINMYSEVIATSQTDTDSTPDNGNGVTANEDDEAALNLPFNNGDGGTGNGEGSIDLELSISTDAVDYTVYENIAYSITITNNGQDAATDVVVSAELPEGMVHTGNVATTGEYNLFFQEWTIDYLGAGESATLDLTLFPLVTNTAITNFVEVFAANQTDTDSTPGNGNGISAEEDDEAALTLGSSAALRDYPGNYSLQFAEGEMTVNHVYPNPTFNELNLNITSAKDADATINLVNIQGTILQSFDRDIIMGVTEMNFDVSNLPAGRYFIQVLGVNGYRQAQSFVKQ